jgi:hypothetical protein
MNWAVASCSEDVGAPPRIGPESLAHLLEAAGGLALERSGAILDARQGAKKV